MINRSSVMISRVLSVATWNLRFNSVPERTLGYLDNARWDVACLQEVSLSASRLLESRADWSVANGLKLDPRETVSARPHGVAIVARHGWYLEDPSVIASTPKPGRGVSARARRGDEAVSVISWHAPNKADEGVHTKMAGYQAFITAIRALGGPLVVGFDSNHWSLRTDLQLGGYDPASPFSVENQFFSATPQHRLQDALLIYLRKNPELYATLLQQRPNGPLEVTYKRGATLDRFDYIMVSDEVEVHDIYHDFDGACSAGSDHGLVSVLLTCQASERGAK
jgi:exonuclease III